MSTITQAPAKWFDCLNPRGRPPIQLEDGPAATRVIITHELVDEIAVDLEDHFTHAEIAEARGISISVVVLIDENRGLWAPQAPRKPSSGVWGGGTQRKVRIIAPEWAEVVPAHKCGDHATVFRPCLICHIRRIIANRGCNS